MRPNRTPRAVAALLFALMLPLRGIAMMPACGHLDAASPDMVSPDAASPAPQHHCDRAPAAHHASCGDCCGCTAVTPTSIRWAAPRPTAPEISVAPPGFPPAGMLDRLDRPPRLILV
jgi:hypothetical protein